MIYDEIDRLLLAKLYKLLWFKMTGLQLPFETEEFSGTHIRGELGALRFGVT